jgi:hypothetical protein
MSDRNCQACKVPNNLLRGNCWRCGSELAPVTGSALIGCECSGIVRDALRSIGIDAWSCDLKPCEGDPQWHIQGDVTEAIVSRIKWDFIGLHPMCKAMSLSGNGTYGTGKAENAKRIHAIAWTCALWELAKNHGRRVYLENPRSVLWQHLGAKSVQWIQPHQFGHGECKATGLALHNLPPLFHEKLVEGREQRVWRMSPGPNRETDRSRSFPGIAGAMARQWGKLISKGATV